LSLERLLIYFLARSDPPSAFRISLLEEAAVTLRRGMLEKIATLLAGDCDSSTYLLNTSLKELP
jgi:hypothetical protein